jgi:hypothetical protein
MTGGEGISAAPGGMTLVTPVLGYRRHARANGPYGETVSQSVIRLRSGPQRSKYEASCVWRLDRPRLADRQMRSVLNEQVCGSDHDPSDERKHAGKQHEVDNKSGRMYAPRLRGPSRIPSAGHQLKLGRTVTVAVQILAILAAFVGAWVGFSLQFCISKVGRRLDFAS